ncbi:hypothetical protein [Helicobacter typhlonius]|uniref:Uncharacterized protein n=1 Tax=Helicobacter typhlonius TaxID=76936 RepID=A0A0S4PTD0_9HELI|nr:hypothetical protein [Helicobacter typhlonius]TLD79367.1 hypothetical protein LS75_000005 [Helicobacter typhlonius]CUU39551.1 Hypothetical protein BN2458_PEG0665 [Helicobacter typhlonius]
MIIRNFIISDHRGFDSIGISRDNQINEVQPDTLLLFKDFIYCGDVRIDSGLMINYDMASILCANLPQGCINVPPHILENYLKNRSVISTIPAHWDLSFYKENEWILNHIYHVKGSIYDREDWQGDKRGKSGEIRIDGIMH